MTVALAGAMPSSPHHSSLQCARKIGGGMADESDSEQAPEAPAGDNATLPVRYLDRTARWGAWALPVWSVLLFLATATHQPDPRTDFAEFARYVTTTQFLISHIVASIIGAAIGVLGLLALFTFLALRVRSGLTLAGLAMAAVGNVTI